MERALREVSVERSLVEYVFFFKQAKTHTYPSVILQDLPEKLLISKGEIDTSIYLLLIKMRIKHDIALAISSFGSTAGKVNVLLVARSRFSTAFVSRTQKKASGRS